VDDLLVDDHIEFSMMYNFRVGIQCMGTILDSGYDPLRKYILWMQSEHDGWMTMIRVAQH
jgi:hypothetical protein